MAAAHSESTSRALRRLPNSTALLAVLLALGQAGCDTPSMMPNLTPSALTGGGLANQPPPTDEAHLRPYVEMMADRYAANPDDKTIAMNYATGLRRLTQHAQAVAVLQRLAVKHSHDLDVLAAYGKALADAGRLQEAQNVLARAHTPDRPNWTILSAQGSVADQLGDHVQAQAYYKTALKIVPNQPQVLSNLGLSYALEHKLPLAEQTLRNAAAQPAADMRVRQNLAMVLATEGKVREAEDVASRDMSPIDAAENVTTIQRSMPSVADPRVARRSSAPVTQETASSEFDR